MLHFIYMLVKNSSIPAFFKRSVQSFLLDETYLSYDIKEAIALLISKENSCKICVDVHKSIAKMLGLSEERIGEILEVVVITGYFSYINILSNVFGLGQ